MFWHDLHVPVTAEQLFGQREGQRCKHSGGPQKAAVQTLPVQNPVVTLQPLAQLLLHDVAHSGPQACAAPVVWSQSIVMLRGQPHDTLHSGPQNPILHCEHVAFALSHFEEHPLGHVSLQLVPQ